MSYAVEQHNYEPFTKDFDEQIIPQSPDYVAGFAVHITLCVLEAPVTSSASSDWKLFELAVAQFIAAIGQGAKVTHDVRRPDVHTGHARQRDVWVEWSFGGHFPAKALISCKHWAVPLDQSDLDHFNGEFISSGAQLGIIYSKAGFNDRALEKAKALGFHCCQLYDDEPAELPESLAVGLAYNFRLRLGMLVHGSAEFYRFKQWKEVLDLPSASGTVRSVFVQGFDAFQAETDNKKRWNLARNGQKVLAHVREEGKPPLDVELHITCPAFQAKLEYTTLDGSYNITAGHFLGSVATPMMDMQSAHPGPGWIELAEVPDEMPARLLAIYAHVDPLAALNRYAEKAFPATRD